MSFTTLKVNKKLFKSWYEIKTSNHDVLYKYQRSTVRLNEEVLLPTSKGQTSWRITTSSNLTHSLISNNTLTLKLNFEYELFRSVFELDKEEFFWILEPDDTARLYRNRKEVVGSLRATYNTSISSSELEISNKLGISLQGLFISSGLKTLQLMEAQGRTFGELRRRLKTQEQLREDALTEGTMFASASGNLASSLAYLI
ncbi:hypothetical protein K7432_006981 [Basidiobolus ranarum]|uniref:Uncharacterized protein n=1 Tax=Basidiobolus ranarum TaxID=34480 RepID=A0ABR2WU10_9FUNG